MSSLSYSSYIISINSYKEQIVRIKGEIVEQMGSLEEDSKSTLLSTNSMPNDYYAKNYEYNREEILKEVKEKINGIDRALTDIDERLSQLGSLLSASLQAEAAAAAAAAAL